MQKVVTFDPNKTTGRRYEFLPRRIVTIEPNSIKEELLDSSTLCAICEQENLEVYEVPISFNADDGLNPTALLPLIKTLPIDQVKKLKDIFFKRISDEYKRVINKHNEAISHMKIYEGTFEEKFSISFDDFKKLYINTKGHNEKSDEEIRSDFKSLVEKTKIFEVKSRSFLPPKLFRSEECYLELFDRLIQMEQQIADDTMEIYSMINDFKKERYFDLNNVKNIENIPKAMLYTINSKELDNEEKGKFVQDILISFNKDGNGILKRRELLDLLSTKPEFGKLLYNQLDRIKENNKKEDKQPYRTIELFSEELKHDIAMTFWHPETATRVM